MSSAWEHIGYTGGGTSFTQDFTYDTLNRLSTSQEQSGSSWTQTNGYDRYGNRTVTAGTGTALTFNAANNRITTSGYTYDSAGNVIVDPSHSYTFDAENKILKLDTVLAYAYDGEGKRVRKFVGENTRFVYGIGGELLAEYNGSTGAITKEYINGASGLTATIDPTNGTQYLTPDHLGSPRVVTNSSASVTQRRDFMPFGEEVTAGAGRSSGSGWSSTSSPRQKFTGNERDTESGLDYFYARYYKNTVGRFLSYDPVFVTDGRLVDPQRLNLYIYARSNPFKFVDRNGEDITISGNNEEDARKKFNIFQNGLNVEDRKQVTFKVGDGKNGYAKGTFYILVDKNHKSDSQNFQAVQTAANDRGELVRTTVLKEGEAYTIRYYGDRNKLKTASGKFAQSDFEGYSLFQNRAKNKDDEQQMLSAGAYNEMLINAAQSDEELAATFFHELRAHILLADFGRTTSKAVHSQACAGDWTGCTPTTRADIVGMEAEKEARSNAKKKP